MIVEGERPSKKQQLDLEQFKHMAHGFSQVTPGTRDWIEMVRAASFAASADVNIMLSHLSNIRSALEPNILPDDYAAGFLITHAAHEAYDTTITADQWDLLLNQGFDLFIRNLTVDELLQHIPPDLRRQRLRVLDTVIQDAKDGMYIGNVPESRIPPVLTQMRVHANQVTMLWENDFEERYGLDPLVLAESCIPLDPQTTPEAVSQHLAAIATGILDAHELHRTSSNREVEFVVG